MTDQTPDARPQYHSATVKVYTPGGFDVLVTLRGYEGAQDLVDALLGFDEWAAGAGLSPYRPAPPAPTTPAPATAPAGASTAPTGAPGPAAVPAGPDPYAAWPMKGSLAQTPNPPESRPCPLHGGNLKLRTAKDGSGEFWYSHKAGEDANGNPIWCRGE